MSVKQPSLRGLAAQFVVLAIFLAVTFASATRPDAAVQEKNKKEEKKEEKKDEKKGLPLKSDRKIEFTTDEGTWLSLDVSPDGKTIVFELVGDIFTLPIEGGQAKLISSEIWMYHVDGGSGVQITKSKPTPTTERNKRPNAMGAVASLDGKYLYYASKLGSLSYNQQFPSWHITRRDRKTGDEDDLIHQIKSAFRPVLSPDGKQVLYVTRYETESGLRLRNLESGEDRWVKYPVTR